MCPTRCWSDPSRPLQFSGRTGGPIEPACRSYVLTNSTTNTAGLDGPELRLLA